MRFIADNLELILIKNQIRYFMKYVITITIAIWFLTMCTLSDSFGQQDIVKLTAEKYQIEDSGKTFVIHYGYAGSFEVEVGDNPNNPKVISMKINHEKKSLEINLEKTQEPAIMWFRIPNELLSAENEKFLVYNDGKNKGYDLVSYDEDVRIGMVVNNGTQTIDIVGTKVIPEFNILASITLGISMSLSVFFSKTQIQKKIS